MELKLNFRVVVVCFYVSIIFNGSPYAYAAPRKTNGQEFSRVLATFSDEATKFDVVAWGVDPEQVRDTRMQGGRMMGFDRTVMINRMTVRIRNISDKAVDITDMEFRTVVKVCEYNPLYCLNPNQVYMFKIDVPAEKRVVVKSGKTTTQKFFDPRMMDVSSADGFEAVRKGQPVQFSITKASEEAFSGEDGARKLAEQYKSELNAVQAEKGSHAYPSSTWTYSSKLESIGYKLDSDTGEITKLKGKN